MSHELTASSVLSQRLDLRNFLRGLVAMTHALPSILHCRVDLLRSLGICHDDRGSRHGSEIDFEGSMSDVCGAGCGSGGVVSANARASNQSVIEFVFVQKRSICCNSREMTASWARWRGGSGEGGDFVVLSSHTAGVATIAKLE